MKKLFALLLCVMLFVTSVPAFAAETVVLGDVENDGVLDKKDVNKLAEYLAGYVKVVEEFDDATLKLADMDGNGKISSADLLALVKIVPETKGPIIILKCDDMKSNNLDAVIAFENFYNLFKEEGVTAAFGIVGNSASSGNQTRFWQDVNTFIEGGIEIWSHGWMHRKNDAGQADYNGNYTYDEMKTQFQKVLDLVANKANGYQITSFGPPYNQLSAEAAEMLNNDFPQITSVFFPSKAASSVLNSVQISSRFDLEGGAITLENFKKLYDARGTSEYYAIQMHPANYDETERDELRKIIRFLKDENCTFMTPSQYVEYVNNK